MRRRLLAVLMVLMGAATLLLSVPLAGSYASGRTEHLLLQRRADAVRFADLADRVRTAADRAELATEIRRYTELYGASVTVVDSAGRVLAQAGAGITPSSAADVLGRALTGRSTERLPTVRPWGPDRVVLAEPVGRDERVSGAVLLAVPTTAARRDVTVRWALIACGALTAFAAAALVAAGITRWLMRPVRDLDRAVAALASGSLRTRADSDTGPPELRSLRRHFNGMAEAVADSSGASAPSSRTPRTNCATRWPPWCSSWRTSSRISCPAPAGRSTRGPWTRRSAWRNCSTVCSRWRVESGTAERTEQDVSRGVRERVAAWQPVFEASGLTLSAAAVREGLRAAAVPDAVGRVLDAVLDNAVKFIPSGGRVAVAAALADGEVVVRVADDGPGYRRTSSVAHPTLHPGARASERARHRPGPGHRRRDRPPQRGRLATAGNRPHGLVVELRLPCPVPGQP
ncbi:HAMP domain-containing protein [Streptomyces diastatochromogenes]|nr:HAMP domain-containing protein [Streptomyces diastatochromogenes]